MYLQITTRCNMTCEHCCMNCYSDGDDMSMETVKNALETFKWNNIITIGGGEPTIHPKFWEIFGEVMARQCEMPPYIVTNGSIPNIAKALANMARSGVIGAALSQDDYHDPIEQEVIDAFTKPSQCGYVFHDNDWREIRNVTGNEINAGRCDFGNDDDCPCHGFIIQPNGDVKLCGCDDAPIVGNVNDGFDPSEFEFEDDHCVKSWQKEKVYA